MVARSRHNITNAQEMYAGNAWSPGAFGSKRGLPAAQLAFIDFGAPATADADGVAASQAVVVLTTPLAVINGALASGGVATFDVPRNVVAAWTGTAVVTITGTDRYGRTMVESSASGTSLAGKKAFKTVTSVSFSADVTGATVGSGDVLGLPFRVNANGVVAARANGAIDAGTFVAAVTTEPATATTGDVMGTFDPAVALNGTNTVGLLVVITDNSTMEGAYGVANFAG